VKEENEKEKQLLNLLLQIPPDFKEAERFLAQESCSKKEISSIALEYIDACIGDINYSICNGDDMLFNKTSIPAAEIQDLNSTYLFEVIKFLLNYGLDPNLIIEDNNVMMSLCFVANELIAADTFAMLLEHGGNYNLACDGETIFQTLSFMVFNDAYEEADITKYRSAVHCWMVAIGYGARYEHKEIEVFRTNDTEGYFDLNMLKNHRDYDFELKKYINIYEKSTRRIVARIPN